MRTVGGPAPTPGLRPRPRRRPARTSSYTEAPHGRRAWPDGARETAAGDLPAPRCPTDRPRGGHDHKLRRLAAAPGGAGCDARGVDGARQPRRAQRRSWRGDRPHARGRGRVRDRRRQLRPHLAGRRVHCRRGPGQDHPPARHAGNAQRDRDPARPSLRLRPGLPGRRWRPRRDRPGAPDAAVRAGGGDRRADGRRRPPDLAVHEPAGRALARAGGRDRPHARRAGHRAPTS